VGNKVIQLKKGGYRNCISHAIKRHGSELEKLFRTSAKTGVLMQITLKNNKVYIGFSNVLPVPKESDFLIITPLLSGYRESETKLLKFTTDYFDVIDSFVDNTANDYNIDVLIRKDEILTASLFDYRVYEFFNKKNLNDNDAEEDSVK